jgi:hypothetical protein
MRLAATFSCTVSAFVPACFIHRCPARIPVKQTTCIATGKAEGTGADETEKDI